ncbi:MAG: hypothetical protein GXO25_05865 [Euryarchaeota archaeon]|nr:hypothetical protein [Euryarchaeota archaeon]
MEGKDFINTVNNGRQIRKPPPVFKKRSDSFKWFVVAVIGIVIIFVGSMWVTMAQWTPPPNANDYHSLEHYKRDKMAWENATQTGNLYGRILIEIGALGMVVGAMFGIQSAALDDTEKRIFTVLLVLGVLVLIVVSVGLFVSSPYY